MKLVFAHDHVFYKYENQFFSTGGLSKEMLERYTKVFEEVVVISRQKEIDALDGKLTLASTDRVSFVQIPNFKSISNVHKLLQAKKIINYEVTNSDALISRLPSSIGAIAVDIARGNGTPYLVEVVACPWDALWNHSFKGKLLAPFTYFSTKTKIGQSKYATYVTNEFLQRRYPTKGKNISCSNVALKEFNNEILASRIQKIENKGSREKIVIGTTAAVNVRYKGQQYIIEALGELKKQGITNYEYHLVGGGSNTYLKSIAQKYDVVQQVKFLGSLSHDKVFEWLDTIDIYAQPSRQEGLPRALIEAMSRGLPSFGARTAGIPELLENKYIISNTKNNIKEILSILQGLSKEELLSQAMRNYGESMKYNRDIIEARRQKFFIHFKNVVQTSQ
ncbi:glycosyl transferase [Priestia megaterium]|uniref:glycosyltransferase family 4 protein n=1 Tax=Priestia megaterium TaxID=1404 RepID=UPI000BF32CDB|nr:glycosyltransferase family 4 protein [Priestia megaterium]PEU59998.1 glycosyl transferase [Priestia megaterium]